MKKLTDEQIKALTRPLPQEAITKHQTKNYLSNIKAIYVTERFNEVFGTGCWYLDYEIISVIPKAQGSKVGDMIVLDVCFTVPEYGIRLRSYGGNNNEDTGDAYKGAVTDAITKIGSYLGVGIDVFKGIQTHDKPIAKNDIVTLTEEELAKLHDEAESLKNYLLTIKDFESLHIIIKSIDAKVKAHPSFKNEVLNYYKSLKKTNK